EATESRIFFGQPLEAFAELLAVGLGLGLDGHADDRLGERGRFERDVEILVTERVACSDVAQTDESGDVAREDVIDVFAFAALNDHEAADALAAAGAGIVNGVAFFQLARIDTEKDELAGINVGPKFERQRAELAAIVGLDGGDVDGSRLGALSGRDIQRAGQIIDDGIDEGLDAFFLEGVAAEARNQLDFAGQTADGGLQDFRGNRLVFDDQLGDFVVFIGDGMNKFLKSIGGLFLQVSGDFGDLEIQAFLLDFARTPDDGLLIDDIDQAREVFLGADGQENGISIRAEFLAHVGEGVVEIRAGAVHLVDEGD